MAKQRREEQGVNSRQEGSSQGTKRIGEGADSSQPSKMARQTTITDIFTPTSFAIAEGQDHTKTTEGTERVIMGYLGPGFNPYASNENLFATNKWDTNPLDHGLCIQGNQPQWNNEMVKGNLIDIEA